MRPKPDNAWPGLTADPGTYILVLRMKRSTRLRVGKQGLQDFPEGLYLYVGSAFGPGGLKARVGRHLRSGKKLKWHIDYLRRRTTVSAVWYVVGQRLECHWSSHLNADPASSPVIGFGASDCQCASHLYHFAGVPASLQVALECEALPINGRRR